MADDNAALCFTSLHRLGRRRHFYVADFFGLLPPPRIEEKSKTRLLHHAQLAFPTASLLFSSSFSFFSLSLRASSARLFPPVLIAGLHGMAGWLAGRRHPTAILCTLRTLHTRLYPLQLALKVFISRSMPGDMPNDVVDQYKGGARPSRFTKRHLHAAGIVEPQPNKAYSP